MTCLQIRQGDVLLQQVDQLPWSCIEQEHETERLVLAFGELTGHAHAIYDFQSSEEQMSNASGELAQEEIKKAQRKARLWVDMLGNRFLEVRQTVNLCHEEHTTQMIPVGIYALPVQVEYDSGAWVQVED